MYFRERSKTCRVSGKVKVSRRTKITELPDYTYERMPDDEVQREIVPGFSYHGVGGLEFVVMKILDKDRVIAKLREGHSLTLPIICLDDFDTDFYGLPYSDGLFILSTKFILGRVDEIQRYSRVLIKVPGFKSYDNFHVIGKDNLMIDLELFVVSLTVSLSTSIESIGEVMGIEKNTLLEHKIVVSKKCRSTNHIIDDEGFLNIEVRFPQEVILFKELQYFSITYDDSFSIDKTTGEAIGGAVTKEEQQFILPKQYFLEDGWKNSKILF